MLTLSFRKLHFDIMIDGGLSTADVLLMADADVDRPKIEDCIKVLKDPKSSKVAILGAIDDLTDEMRKAFF